MATFGDLEGEINAIADAFLSINHYIYGERSSINFEDRTKTYPVLLLDSKQISFEISRYSRNHLPADTDYNLVLYIMDDYNKSEQSLTTLSEKESAVKVIGDQFFAELMNRTKSSDRSIMLLDHESQPGSIIDDQHNNRVVEIRYNFKIRVTDTTCTLGTFNYSSDDLVWEDGNNAVSEGGDNLTIE